MEQYEHLSIKLCFVNACVLRINILKIIEDPLAYSNNIFMFMIHVQIVSNYISGIIHFVILGLIWKHEIQCFCN